MFEPEAIVKFLILPSNVVTIAAIASVLLVPLRWARRWSLYLGGVALAVYAISGSGPVAFLLLGHLEYQIAPATLEERSPARIIVVLAGHAEYNPDYPLSSQVNSASAVRLLEAVRLFRSAPKSSLIVSGGGEAPLIMRDVLVALGVSVEKISVDSGSDSTFESARNLASTLGKSPFLLVTSAGHMPRAVGVFRKAGTTPLPVPTHFLTQRNWLATQYLPSPMHLECADLAVSEYAALIWYAIKGRV
jgi:uncharacterized SAM-binding protein YcdF (DUF218 family)